MASSKEYLEFVLEQLSELDGLRARPMMGEYLLYYGGKLVGGVYDDRLLLKPTPGAKELMGGENAPFEIPYEGAKPMLGTDIDNRELTCRVIMSIAEELPEKKKAGGSAKQKRKDYPAR